MRISRFLMASAAVGALVVTPAYAQDADDDDSGYGDIIVTAQRQSQTLQEVPIAVSAFSSESLEAQQIENASDLQLTLPNVTFSKGNFTGSSFTIRGIGDLCVGTSCDSATAIHMNSAPLFGTRLFETEYFDLERIEVLRGPQGTLFGRSATSGVVNVVTAKPNLDGFEAKIDGEYGNFNAVKLKGMVNIPIGETLAARVAGFYLRRDGYTQNLFNNTSIDGRDMYAVRGSIRWEPSPDTTVDLMGYYFREKDDRARIQKQLCQRDPTGVLGCLAATRDFGKVNTNATFTGTLGSSEFLAIAFAGTPLAPLAANLGLNSLYGPDAHANFQEPRDVRQVRTDFTPEYLTDELQAQLHIEHNFGSIQASLTGTYQSTSVDSRQDYNTSIVDRTGFATALATISAVPTFAPVAAAIIPNGPAGNLCTSDTDPTGLGSYGGNRICSPTPISLDRSNNDGSAWSVEGIVSSDFDGPFNFLLGGIYAQANQEEGSYYVNAFAIDYIAGVLGAGNGGYLGTPFFRNNTRDFKLTSYGIFGEAYWDVSDSLKLTVGLRYNNDKKSLRARSTLASFLVPFGQTGDAFNAPAAATFDADAFTPGVQPFSVRNVGFDAITGRAVVDWKVTDDNLVYFSYSRGYKSGGINPPLQPIFPVPQSFVPEFIDSFEIGSKNSFAGGVLQLNATAFYYKYKDLQLSRIIARTAVNDNVDANIYGLEIEAVVRPDPDWLINLGFSWLETEVTSNKLFSNPRDPGGGRADAVIIKDIQNGSNCAVTPNAAGSNAASSFVNAVNGAAFPALQPTVAFPNGSGIASQGGFGICGALDTVARLGAAALNPALAALQPLLDSFGGVTVSSPGVPLSIKGNKLPQAPNFKFSVGAQHTMNFDNGMSLVPRVDVTYTGDSFGNIFNGKVNKIEGYAQANASITLHGSDDRWYVKGFVSNIFDNNATTGLYLTDASSGLFTNIFTLDPRRYGLAIGAKF